MLVVNIYEPVVEITIGGQIYIRGILVNKNKINLNTSVYILRGHKGSIFT